MYYIGVDLGGTNIAIGIVNDNYEIVRKGSTRTNPHREPDLITADMADLIKRLLSDEGLTVSDIESVGVAAPGTANSATGIIEYANNIPFLNYPLADRLSAMLGGMTVYIENDANAAAKAEAIAGVAKGSRSSVMVTLGTGVGGGIIMDGKIYSGFNFAGAELGHIVIEENGRPCSCGRRGCWEAYSSATGLANLTRESIIAARKAGIETVMDTMIGGDLTKASARTPFAAMKAGDEIGRAVVDEYISYLACGIVNIINTLHPEVLSIGGGVSGEGEYLTVPLTAKVLEETGCANEAELGTKILTAKLRNDAGIIGAAVLGK